MINLKLPNWIKGTFLAKLVAAVQAWFVLLESFLLWPLQQLDVKTCHVGLLENYAYQRYIRKIYGEPEALYRLRIHTAFLNAEDAGTIPGIKKIFNRLGITITSINQHIAGRHWAVVEIEISDDVFAQYGAVLQEVMSGYGRLCRTYEFKIISHSTIRVRTGDMQFKSNTVIAR
ncbi:MAG: hypothetical protein RPT25_06695 [Cycloclasticus sp.]